MSTPSPHDLVLASLDRPPIDVLPSDERRPDLLTAFVEEHARPLGGVPVALSPAVTVTLWTETALTLIYAGFLVAVRAGVTPCSGVACTAATWGGHTALALVLALGCAGALVVAMLMTRGLTQADGPRLALIVIAALSGLVALAGVLLLLVVLGIALALFVAFVDRI